MSTDDWTIKSICISNHAQPSGETTKIVPTTYHSPRLKRTIMGGPGNRSSIIDCSCGACYEYSCQDDRMSDWYAQHAGIAGGSNAVAKILRQYDEARDIIDYPNHPQTHGKSTVPPKEILGRLRVASAMQPIEEVK